MDAGSAYKSGLFQEMEDESFINQWMEAALQDSDLLLLSLLDDHHQLPIKSAASSEDYLPNNRPKKQLRANSWGSFIINERTPSPEPHSNFSASNDNYHAAVASSSFFYPPCPPGQFTLNRSDHHHVWNCEATYAMKSCQRSSSKTRTMSASASTGTPLAQDHVIAERKRREKLSQRFIALSAVVPGLKKTDKASVLTDAIMYLKQLQERVRTLEDQNKAKTVESVVLVKKSKFLIDGGTKPFANDTFIEGEPDEEVPEIEARVCDKDMLIRVHCDNKKGVAEKVFGEISKLNLTICNTSVLTFGSSALDITIVARMDAKCCITVTELVKTLRVGFMSFM